MKKFKKFFKMAKDINHYEDKSYFQKISFIMIAPFRYQDYKRLSKKFDK